MSSNSEEAPSSSSPYSSLIPQYRPDLGPYEAFYKELHAHGELSMEERETAGRVVRQLQKISPDFDIRTSIGGYGLVAILKNSTGSEKQQGKTILLRADMDALPVEEETDVDYASKKTMEDVDGTVKPVMHACGHDLHVTTALATAETLLALRDQWNGAVIFLFQPGEEQAKGARAMVDDGLYDPKRHNCPIPDVVLGQHVLPFKSGTVATRFGAPMSAADSFEVTIYGRGGHASMPHLTVDPIVLACHIVVRWQTIISREVPPSEIAVLTVGSLQSGSTEDVISSEAVLKINVRSVSPRWRTHILDSIKRVTTLECEIARCPKPPSFHQTSRFPLTLNDDGVMQTIRENFTAYFGKDRHNSHMENALASEDFSILATAVDRPCAYWFWGGVDPDVYDEHERAGTLAELPGNHSSKFVPVLQPSLRTGVDALTVAALSVLAAK